MTEDQARTMTPRELIHTAITHGWRTVQGRELVAVWRNVTDIEPGDVLAGLRAGSDRHRASAQLAVALKVRTWADVVAINYSDDVQTAIDVTTRMGSSLTRSWRNSASLPVLKLVSTSENLST